jgi:hypothetical protein
MAAVPIKKSNVVEFWQKKTVSAAWQATTIEEVDGRVTGTFLKKIAQTVQFCRIYVLHNTTFTVKKVAQFINRPKIKGAQWAKIRPIWSPWWMMSRNRDICHRKIMYTYVHTTY